MHAHGPIQIQQSYGRMQTDWLLMQIVLILWRDGCQTFCRRCVLRVPAQKLWESKVCWVWVKCGGQRLRSGLVRAADSAHHSWEFGGGGVHPYSFCPHHTPAKPDLLFAGWEDSSLPQSSPLSHGLILTCFSFSLYVKDSSPVYSLE